MHTRYAVLDFLETVPNNLEGLNSDIFKSFDTLDTISHDLVECTLIYGWFCRFTLVSR